MIYKIKSKIVVFAVVLLFGVSACEITPIENPNGPTLESLQNGASLADIRLIASGVESLLRGDMEFYYWTVSIVGREYYDLNNTDPRYTGELLGAQGAQLDNNGFLTTRTFAANYRTIRNAYLLIEAVENSNAGLSDAEKNAMYGFARTVQAYSLLLVANRQYNNGVRLDTEDPDNLGPFTADYQASLAGIAALLDVANLNLSGGATDFPFNSSLAPNVQAMIEFNRAIAARVALYQGDKAGALSALNASFFDLGGDLNMGPAHIFGTGGNDRLNPLFNVAGQDLYGAHDSWVADAEAGDTRVAAKTTPFAATVSADGLSADNQVTIYSSNTAPVSLIRNEELILIYAEANIGSNNTEAVNAINVIRNAAGLADYAGGTSAAELLDEVLKQRRYSLFGEGHRWIDLRRTGKLSEIPLDRAGDTVHEQFPRPVLEG